jgi:hypothetical protein
MKVRMKWPDWVGALPLLRTRRALAAALEKRQHDRREIERLRGRLESQNQRLEAEKRKRRALERRLIRLRREHRPTAARPSPVPPFHAGDAAGRYRVANVVSYPKSGRTWFSTLYFHYARHHFGAAHLEQQSLHMPDRHATFQQFLAEHASHGAFPVCVFTHLGFSARKSFEAQPARWPGRARSALKRPTVLIVRDPRDVVVSHYHHLRALPGALEPDPGLSAFVRGDWGILRVVRFMNMWAEPLRAGHPNLRLCSYESLRRDTAGTFRAALEFLGATVDAQALQRAVDESRFEKLRSRERANREHGDQTASEDAFRFRRGTVGGYVRELSEADVAYLDAVVGQSLDDVFAEYRTRDGSPAARSM